jgi:hypothetical protein
MGAAATDRVETVLPPAAHQPPAPLESGHAFLPGPAESQPPVPAVEPIRAIDAPASAPPPDKMRYAAFDSDAGASPLDVAELDRPAEPIRRWSPREALVPELPAPIGDRDALDRPEEEVYSPPVPEPEAPGSTVNLHDAYEPTAIDVTGPQEPPAPARTRWLPLAAMLVLGLAGGFIGGWLAFGGRGEGTRAPVSAPAPTASDRTRPREATDVAVTEPERNPTTDKTPAAAATPAPAPAAPRASEARPSGRLVVRTRPSGARVEINGRSRGTSPLTLTDLPYGRHTVRITQDGYTAAQRRVTLSARRPAHSLDVPLTRTARAAAPASRASEPSGNAYVGSVVVESRPAGAQVFLDGRGVGVTPLSIPSVPIGSHVVRLELSGHKRWSTPIRVVAGERVRVAASLEETGLE